MRPKNPIDASSKPRLNGGSKTLDTSPKDPASTSLLDGASALGNSEMQALLRRGSKSREALLQFLVERLTQLHQLQLNEAALLKTRDEWFLRVHRGSDFLPRPDRWHASAALYRDAAKALARGDNTRCWQLIRSGLESEKSAKTDAPKALKLQHLSPPKAPTKPPDGLSGSFDANEATQLAEKILNRTHQVDPASTRRKTLHNWFAPEEQEEEEEEQSDVS